MFYSQYGQDEYFHNLFKKRSGFFIDVGAYDGLTYSNSYFFEKLGWDGICIEPLPAAFKKLQVNRNCINVNCGILNLEDDLDFVHIIGDNEMLSGFNRIDVADKSIQRGGSFKIIKVPTFRLESILNKYEIKEADFCSIDVEGSELSVVKSIDWSKFNIQYLCIEANEGIDNVIKYLSPYYKEYDKIYATKRPSGEGLVVGDLIFKKI